MNVSMNIAEDLSRSPAEREALRIFNGWLPQMLRLVRRAITLPLAAGSADAIVLEGASVRAQLEGTWLRFAHGPKKHPAVAMSFGGPIVERVASRVPFSRVGDLALSSLTIHWQDQLGVGLLPVTTEADIAELKRTFFAEDLVVASIELTAPARGQLIVAAHPRAWL